MIATLVPEKKNHLKPDTSGSILPTPCRQRSYSPSPAQRIVKCRGLPGGGGGMLKFQFDRSIMPDDFTRQLGCLREAPEESIG